MKPVKYCLAIASTILLSASISFADCGYSKSGLKIPVPNTYNSSELVSFSPWSGSNDPDPTCETTDETIQAETCTAVSK